ncbi:uncharacterized protein LOC135388771 isoform X2 [Ornithodoros turicata]|uniref:uncharacterized protein LOC135388771 isoform X2 n=1 Tax=Ornithodoros turicata TaxID=34597 RepID=UPI0031388BFA
MAKILKHLGFGKKPPMPPRVDYNLRSYMGLARPVRCNSESNLLEAVAAEERAANSKVNRSQDDTQLVLLPDYCDPADLKEQFRREMGTRRKLAAASTSKSTTLTTDDDFYSMPYETPPTTKGTPSSPSHASVSSSDGQQRKGTPQPPPHSSSHAQGADRQTRHTDEAPSEPCPEEPGTDEQCTGDAPAPRGARRPPLEGQADEMARQRHIYETAFDSRIKQRDDGILGTPHGLRAGPLHPAPSSSQQQGHRKTQDVGPRPPPHQGSGGSSVPTPAPRGSSGNNAPVPATRASGAAARQAEKAIYQNQPLPPPQSPLTENPSFAVKRPIHAGVKVLPSEPLRRSRHGHRKDSEGSSGERPPVLVNGFKATSSDNVSTSSSDNSPRKPEEKRGRHAPPPHSGPLQNGALFRASPSADSLSTSSADSPRKPEEKRGRLVAVAPPTVLNGVGFKPLVVSATDSDVSDSPRRLEEKHVLHIQSPHSDTRPEGDYDHPWDLPRLKKGESPPQVPDHRTKVQTPPAASHAQQLVSPEPVVGLALSTPSSVVQLPASPSVATTSSSSSNTSLAAEASPQSRPSGPARPLLNLNLNLNASNSPKRSRHNLTLNFGCAALSVIGEKVDPSVPLEKQGWYHGSISRLDAENLLRVLKEGSYLVRNSESSKHDYSLSLKSARGFMHMKIVHNNDGKFILGQFSKPFESIPEMIHHYSVNKLPIKGAEHMSLLYPVIDQLL